LFSEFSEITLNSGVVFIDKELLMLNSQEYKTLVVVGSQ